MRANVMNKSLSKNNIKWTLGKIIAKQKLRYTKRKEVMQLIFGVGGAGGAGGEVRVIEIIAKECNVDKKIVKTLLKHKMITHMNERIICSNNDWQRRNEGKVKA